MTKQEESNFNELHKLSRYYDILSRITTKRRKGLNRGESYE